MTERKPLDWAKVIPPESDLQRFRLALMAGHSVEDARKISKSPPPMHYDGRGNS